VSMLNLSATDQSLMPCSQRSKVRDGRSKARNSWLFPKTRSSFVATSTINRENNPSSPTTIENVLCARLAPIVRCAIGPEICRLSGVEGERLVDRRSPPESRKYRDDLALPATRVSDSVCIHHLCSECRMIWRCAYDLCGSRKRGHLLETTGPLS
jgi:hypothetical protein